MPATSGHQGVAVLPAMDKVYLCFGHHWEGDIPDYLIGVALEARRVEQPGAEPEDGLHKCPVCGHEKQLRVEFVTRWLCYHCGEK